MKQRRVTIKSPSWVSVLAVVTAGHLALGWLPIAFSDAETASSPTPISISLVSAPQPEVVEAPVVETPPVNEPAPEIPAPKPIKKPAPKQKPAPVEKVAQANPQPIAAVESNDLNKELPETTSVEALEHEVDPLAEFNHPEPQQAIDKPSKLAETKPAPAAKPTVDLQRYGTDVFRAVNAQQNYPRMAQRMRMEGTATVRIRINQDGSLAARPSIVSSTKHELLDDEVLRMVEVAAPFEALPEGYSQSEAEFVIPIRFSLSAS